MTQNNKITEKPNDSDETAPAESHEAMERLILEDHQGIENVVKEAVAVIEHVSQGEQKAAAARIESVTENVGIGQAEGEALMRKQQEETAALAAITLSEVDILAKKGARENTDMVFRPESLSIRQILQEPAHRGAETVGGTAEEQIKAFRFKEELNIQKGKPIVLEEVASAQEGSEQKYDHRELQKEIFSRLRTIVERERERFLSQFTVADTQTLKVLFNKLQSGDPERRTLAKYLLNGLANLPAEKENPRSESDAQKLFDSSKENFFSSIVSELGTEGMFGTNDSSQFLERMSRINAAAMNRGDYELGALYEKAAKTVLLPKVKNKAQPKKPETETIHETVVPEEASIPLPKEEILEKETGERLLGASMVFTEPSKRGLEAPQEWLNQDREQAYAALQQIFKDIEKTGGQEAIRQWFADFFNPPLIAEGFSPFTPEDFSSLNYSVVSSESVSRVAGREVARPVLMFFDIGEYQRFVTKIWGDGMLSSRGMNLPREIFPEGELLNKTGLLITTADTELIRHEIAHSIDPNLGERKGYDCLLDEVVGYYNSEMVQNLEQGNKNAARLLAAALSSPIYYELYTKETDHVVTLEEFRALATRVAEAVYAIYSRNNDHIETQRTLINIKTVDELLILAG